MRCRRSLGGGAPRAAPRVLIGADCAGLNFGCIPLETLGIDAQLVFASVKDKATGAITKHTFDIKSSKASYDIMERDDSTLPCVDLYTARPPCQSFSLEENGGLHDARGVVFLRVLQLICGKQPRTFILDNALGLRTRHTSTYNFLIDTLQHIKDASNCNKYKVRAGVLNSRDIGGPHRTILVST